MLKLIKNFFKKIIYGNKSSSKRYINFLNKKGANIDESAIFYAPMKTHVDEQYLFLIHIEKNVNIAKGVAILTHDYSWSVAKANDKVLIGSSGVVIIGENSFIGENAILLPNTKIGKNCIIGAGSVVKKNIPDNEVWGGNPAKFICKYSEYLKKRQLSQKEEAYTLYVNYKNRFKKDPDETIFFEYISLFVDFSKEENIKKYKSRLCLMNNEQESINFYLNKKPLYNNFNDMISDFNHWTSDTINGEDNEKKR